MAARPSRRAGRTDWARLALVSVPVTLLSTVLITAVVSGVVPGSFAVSREAMLLSGQTVKISADTLKGKKFAQYVAVDGTGEGSRPAAVTRVESADLKNLCQSAVLDMPVVGKVTLRILAGGGDHPAHADELVVHTDDISGDATFQDIVIGKDASTISGLSDAPAGSLGEQATSVRIDHLRQKATGVTASVFRLNGLHLTVKRGDRPCY